MSPSVRREAVEALFSRPEGIKVLLWEHLGARALADSNRKLTWQRLRKPFKRELESRHPAPHPKKIVDSTEQCHRATELRLLQGFGQPSI